MDGYITIGAKLDDKQLEKDLNKAQSELLKLDKEAERLQEKKVFIDLDLKPYRKALAELKEATDRELYLYGKTDEDVVKILEQEEGAIKQINEEYEKQLQKLAIINSKIKENAEAQENMKGQISAINSQLGQTKTQLNLRGINNNVKKIGNSMNGTVKSVIRWGLALLGIRTALSLLSRSFSTLTQYNEELANRVEYMRLVLATALEPVILWLVDMAERLLQIIAQLLNLLFGIDIYGRAMELYSKKTAKGLGSASKSAKELRKQLAGFDEMNVLGDNVDTKGGGAGGGSGFNLKAPEQGEIPEWMKWIVDHSDEILAILLGIASAIILIKLGLDVLKALGIGLLITGLVTAIKKLLKYLKDPSWKNFGSIIQGIGLAIIGLGIATGNVKAIIIGAIVLIVGTFLKYWDNIKNAIEKGVAWLEEKSNWIHKHLGGIIGSIYDTLVADIRFVWNIFKDLTDAIKLKFDGIIQFIKGIFHKDWHEALEGLFKIAKADLTPIFSFVENMFKKIKTVAISWGTSIANATSGIIKGAINTVFGSVERFVNDFISLLNGVIKVVNKISPLSISTVKKIRLPRLAKGGIINQPGRGVMVGGAIGGEAGREGVIPLTDSQQMALLGEAIGKYITINANITNTMNGRVISRELQKIQNDMNFAYNG